MILAISLWDSVVNETISKTIVTDAVQHIACLKWKWVQHLARVADNKWTKRITEWRLRDNIARNRERLSTKWPDDMKRCRIIWGEYGKKIGGNEIILKKVYSTSELMMITEIRVFFLEYYFYSIGKDKVYSFCVYFFYRQSIRILCLLRIFI